MQSNLMDEETLFRLNRHKCEHKDGFKCGHRVSMIDGKPWVTCQCVRDIPYACPKKGGGMKGKKLHRASKNRRCTHCRRVIAKGEMYFKAAVEGSRIKHICLQCLEAK